MTIFAHFHSNSLSTAGKLLINPKNKNILGMGKKPLVVRLMIGLVASKQWSKKVRFTDSCCRNFNNPQKIMTSWILQKNPD